MRNIFVYIFAIFFLANNSFANSSVNSRITSAVIYKNSALIKRVAKVDLTKGNNHIFFRNLPESMIDNSIQVSIKPNSAKLIDIKTESTFIFENKSKIEKLKDKIESIDAQIKVLEEKLKASESYINFLKKLSPFTSNSKIAINEIEKIFTLVERSLQNSYNNIATIDLKIKSLKKQKQILENELSLIDNFKKQSKTLVISLNSLKNMKANIEVSYLVRDVKWDSVYDIYVDTYKQEVTIDHFASILQNTGEDWNNVSIQVSTANPTFFRPTNLTPWYVDIYEPQNIFDKGAKRKSLLFKIAESTRRAPEVSEEPISFSFNLKNNINIPSDNQPHRIYLFSKTLKGDKVLLYYEAIPKLSPYVYLTSEFNNPFDFPLFRGEINIYLDSKFVGNQKITKTYAPNEKMSIYLGVDNSLSIQRKLVKKFTEYSGIVSKTQKVTYEYAITILNGKNKDVNISIKDNYPISQNEKIKINLVEPQNDQAKITKDGIIIWQLNLKPHSKNTVKLKFTVEYPRDVRITGLY